MIKIIYFDFAKVLISYSNAFKKVCFDFNLNFDNFSNFYKKFENDLSLGKITTDEFWEKCIEKYNLNKAKNYSFIKWWVLGYKTIKPIGDLIYSLENKIDIGIISNIGSGNWKLALKYKKAPAIKYKKVYLSYKLKMKKPDPNIYEKIQKETKVNPNELLFIDDKEENLAIPKKMGWKTVLFDMNEAETGIKKIKSFLK
jgi:FMN phosphatase YigB (HAD superfamily)